MASVHPKITASPYDSSPDIPVMNSLITNSLQYYRNHRFLIEDPKEGIAWLKAIGRQNAANLAEIRIHVPASYNWLNFDKPLTGPGWCSLFEWLVARATGLEEVKIFWECDTKD